MLQDTWVASQDHPELPVTLEIFHGCKVFCLIINYLRIRAYFKKRLAHSLENWYTSWTFKSFISQFWCICVYFILSFPWLSTFFTIWFSLTPLVLGRRGGLMLELYQLLVMCKLRDTEWQNLRLHLKFGYSFWRLCHLCFHRAPKQLPASQACGICRMLA